MLKGITSLGSITSHQGYTAAHTQTKCFRVTHAAQPRCEHGSQGNSCSRVLDVEQHKRPVLACSPKTQSVSQRRTRTTRPYLLDLDVSIPVNKFWLCEDSQRSRICKAVQVEKQRSGGLLNRCSERGSVLTCSGAEKYIFHLRTLGPVNQVHLVLFLFVLFRWGNEASLLAT